MLANDHAGNPSEPCCFATIEVAIEEGRGVFDNLTKFIVWTLPTIDKRLRRQLA